MADHGYEHEPKRHSLKRLCSLRRLNGLKADAIPVAVPNVKLSVSPVLIHDATTNVDPFRDEVIAKTAYIVDRNRDDMSDDPVTRERRQMQNRAIATKHQISWISALGVTMVPGLNAKT